MKVVIAPDSFKDALRACEAAEHIALGLRSVVPDHALDLCPISDGGEGFMEALEGSCRHAWRTDATIDPLGRPIRARWLMLLDSMGQPTTAAIELAEASGLERLTPEERNPMRTTTAGTGLLMRQALDEGVKRIILGIGGSATNDAAVGIAQALGIGFDYPTTPGMPHPHGQGQVLQSIINMQTEKRHTALQGVELMVACDVTNPLAGPHGAAHVYAPQKGATPEQVKQLDAGLKHMAKLWREQLGVDVEQLPGAGAAGGTGGGLVAMLGAKLIPGAELVLDTIGFDERIKDADLVITGEGKLDHQSLQGKAAMTVASRCDAVGVPCVALVGCAGEGADEALKRGLTTYHVIGPGLAAEESIRRTGQLLEQAAVKLAHERLL